MKPTKKYIKPDKEFDTPEWLNFRDLLLSADITTGISEKLSEAQIEFRKQLALQLSNPWGIIEVSEQLEQRIDKEKEDDTTFDSLSFEEKVELLYSKILEANF